MVAHRVLDALRLSTSSAHTALETDAEIESRLADPDQRAEAVAAFHRFHAGLEAIAHPHLGRFNSTYEPRPRTPILEQDLKALGRVPDAVPELPALAAPGEALGWIYVADGSMLGGRIIRKRLSAEGRSLTGLTFLDPFGKDTGPRWQAFMALLEQSVEDGLATIEEITRGGVDAFAHARRTLHPEAIARPNSQKGAFA